MLLVTLLQNIAGIHVPHQTASDGAQYAISAKATAKATTKSDRVSGSDENSKKKDQQVAM